MESVAVGTAPADGAPAEGVSKAQLAYAFVRERIENGTYSPGFRLVLGQLARELGVSPVPVREAIRMLEAEGLVTYERNVGAQVALPDPGLYAHTMDTLGVVEGYATASAVHTLTPQRLAESRAISAQLRSTLDAFDPVTFTRLNQAFHESLYRDCPNPHMLDLVERGWRRLQAMRSSTFDFVPGRAAESVAEHEALLDLIERGADLPEIETAARNHRHNTMRAYLALHRASAPQPTETTAAADVGTPTAGTPPSTEPREGNHA
ncbi:GntR family transcriptional regulator [Pseudoclavibacter endophyticus]|uniref:GntR family transcriptional regulator n=1 Tax=Pseudoclavibacter endophyticus TaxID=1778590 RepID=A0A6H9WQN8_9MICO|nr:GntR family transcriptional regulator [Pseudoclavibacter endophyticus]KAB1648381.1 GntR family transcriptional regulator [Pseudoclavibacter endophyticus]GGA72217.1 GntR family transcriptional regulator [Pseudoclavibacter endophyticus]